MQCLLLTQKFQALSIGTGLSFYEMLTGTQIFTSSHLKKINPVLAPSKFT